MATSNRGPNGTHPRSTAQIGGHPIHPMLVQFPIVCFIGVLVTDIVFINNHNGGWATASRYLLVIGLVMAALAALAGSPALTMGFHGPLRPALGMFGLALIVVMAWSPPRRATRPCPRSSARRRRPSSWWTIPSSR